MRDQVTILYSPPLSIRMALLHGSHFVAISADFIATLVDKILIFYFLDIKTSISVQVKNQTSSASSQSSGQKELLVAPVGWTQLNYY